MPIARQVMILTKEGLLLLDYKFRVDDADLMETDPDLLSGMLSAILAVAKETTGGLVQTINQDKYNVLISEGEKIYALLFIDEESRELDNIAKLIVGRFEAKYKEELKEIVTDVSVFKTFLKDLEEIYAQIFKVDAELLTKIIPEVTNIKNVSIFEKPMNHQVYTGPRDPFVSDYEHYFQEFALKLIESQAEFSERTLQFPNRTILDFGTRVIVLEDLGSHVLMIIGENADDILSKIKKIRRKAGLQSLKR
ncbi:MAG: hypothetical protein KAX09_10730 [Candidatus Heimdallarchaeota archaeon]|nr:hypothetical protein [Candidatus Heimdallarchaeota archaeon]MCK4291447.1 hypothetical protein [Candidatus Heimdallarchaeota archaeon]